MIQRNTVPYISICGENMKLSVIAPVYNVADALENCIQSLVSQHYRNVEILLADDGSPDGSAEICDRFAADYNSIVVIHKPNGGVSSARNSGLDMATGDLITFVDSDDTIDADMYEVLISYLDADTDIVHCSYKRIQNGETINVGGSGDVLVQNHKEALEYYLLGRRFNGSLCDKVFRSSVVNDLRFKEDLIINEDVLLGFQLFDNAGQSKYIDICKYNYIIRLESSSTNTVNELRKLTDSRYVCQYMYDHVSEPDLKQIAFNRLVANDLYLYQCLLKNHLPERKEVRQRLQEYNKHSEQLSKRNRTVLAGLLNAPHLYCGVYGIYDKIRKPNWDVN